MAINKRVSRNIEEDFKLVSWVYKKVYSMTSRYRPPHTVFMFTEVYNDKVDKEMATEYLDEFAKELKDMLKLPSESEDDSNLTVFNLAKRIDQGLTEAEAKTELEEARSKAREGIAKLRGYTKEKPEVSESDDHMWGTKKFLEEAHKDFVELDKIMASAHDSLMVKYRMTETEAYIVNYPFVHLLEKMRPLLYEYYKRIESFESLL